MVWLDIEGPAYWSGDQGSNQDFFNGLLSQLRAQGQVSEANSSTATEACLEQLHLCESKSNSQSLSPDVASGRL